MVVKTSWLYLSAKICCVESLSQTYYIILTIYFVVKKVVYIKRIAKTKVSLLVVLKNNKI